MVGRVQSGSPAGLLLLLQPAVLATVESRSSIAKGFTRKPSGHVVVTSDNFHGASPARRSKKPWRRQYASMSNFHRVPDDNPHVPLVAGDGTAVPLSSARRRQVEQLLEATSTPKQLALERAIQDSKLGSSFRLGQADSDDDEELGNLLAAEQEDGVIHNVATALGSVLDDVVPNDAPSSPAAPTPATSESVAQKPATDASETVVSTTIKAARARVDADETMARAEKVVRGRPAPTREQTQTFLQDLIPKKTWRDKLMERERLDMFLAGYGADKEDGENTFASAALFAEVKLRELRDLRRRFGDSYPSAFHTAVSGRGIRVACRHRGGGWSDVLYPAGRVLVVGVDVQAPLWLRPVTAALA